MKSATLALCALLGVAGQGAAQLPGILPAGSYWKDVEYPKVFYTGRDGLTAGAYLAFQAPLTYAQYDEPPPYRASFTLDGQVSKSGSRQISFDARAPFAFDGWRFVLTLASERHARASYFGLGNAAVYDPANQDTEEFFYRSLVRRDYARGEIQRRVVGGLRLLAGFHAEKWRYASLAPASQLAADSAAGADPTLGRATKDVSARVGLVFDTRDDEVSPNHGVLLEAIHAFAGASTAGDLTYTRTTVSGRAYVPAGSKVIIAARALGETMTGTPGVGSYSYIEASDRPFEGIGGALSHRGLLDHRLLGPDKLLGNLDLRVAVFDVPTLIRLSAVGFVDAGRVFPAGDFKVTTQDLKVGAGGGLMLRLLRAGVLGFTVGGGPDGLVVDAHTQWSF